jgi:hypothetical protein
MNTAGSARPTLADRLWGLARHGFHRLPPPWQLGLKRARRAVLRQDDWAAHVSGLRLREQGYLQETLRDGRAITGGKRVAMYTLQHWSPVEYGLAMALRLRGHDVHGVLCDGLLPLCELNLGPIVRPPCRACTGHFARYERAFGLAFGRLTDLLSADDRERAERLVAGTPDHGLAALAVDGVPVGQLARRELQRYYRGFVFDATRDPAYRRWLVSGVLATWFAGRWLDRVRPDILGMCSGRTLSTACAFGVARQRGIHVVTWDGSATHADGLTFSHNLSATEIPLDEAWREASTQPLSDRQRRELDEYMGRWSRSENTPFPYNPTPLDDADGIRRRLGLGAGRPLVVAFTNTAWDIAVIDRDVGFESMFDWLFALVEYAAAHPAVDLVVRAHPAEKKVPRELQSRSPVGPEIRRRFRPLPPNVTLIEGDDPVSSYTLAEMAQVNVVYASRFGLELALRGTRPWIAGSVTYRGKGFTLDVTSREHMEALLEARDVSRRLTGHEVELARRFAYLWFFRYVVRLPLLRPPDRRFTLATFRQLGPGGDPVLDDLCDALVTGRPFLDIGRDPASVGPGDRRPCGPRGR